MTKRNLQRETQALSRDTFDKHAMIEDLLACCRKAAKTCFALSHRNQETATVIQGYLVGTKLAKTALTLAAALEERGTEFTHRIIVERAEPAQARVPTPPTLPPPSTPERTGPPPPEKKSKTICGGPASAELQDGDKPA